MRFLVILALVACKSGASQSTAGSAAPASGSAAPPPSSHIGSAIAATLSPVLDAGIALANTPERCATPCRFLTDTALADAPARVERECKRAWPYTECDDNLYQVNCVYAAHGYAFKRPEWQAKFRDEPWYHVRADFTESELSAQENAAIHELKERDKTCHAAITEPVSEADVKLVRATLGDLNSANAAEEPIRNMTIGERTKLRYTARAAGVRTIEVEHPFWAVGAGKYSDSSFSLTFDRADKLLRVE